MVTAVRAHDDVGAVVVPAVADLRRVACLTGADARTAERYLRARLLVVHDVEAPPGGHPSGHIQADTWDCQPGWGWQ